MARMIDADALKERLKVSPIFPDFGQDGFFIRDMVIDLVDNQRTVDAVEVVRGEWKARNHRIIGDWSIMCSVCGYRERRGPAYEISDGMYNYCPNCGAKMDGERKVSE